MPGPQLEVASSNWRWQACSPLAADCAIARGRSLCMGRGPSGVAHSYTSGAAWPASELAPVCAILTVGWRKLLARIPSVARVEGNGIAGCTRF
eukprot:2810908-Prymnesium_polylepis.1